MDFISISNNVLAWRLRRGALRRHHRRRGPPLAIRSALHSFLSFDRRLFRCLSFFMSILQRVLACRMASPLVRLHLITSDYIRLHQITSDYFELLWQWSNKHRICTCIIVQATNYVYKFNFYGVALPVPLL